MPVIRPNNASAAFGTFGRIAADIMGQKRHQATQMMSLGAGLQAQAAEAKGSGRPEVAADLFDLGGQFLDPAHFKYRDDGTRTIGNTAGGNTVPASLTARLAAGNAAPAAAPPAIAPPPIPSNPRTTIPNQLNLGGPTWPSYPLPLRRNY